jgi:hypothetical protein
MKIGVVTNELKNYLLEAAQRASSSTCKMLLRKVEPTNELSIDSWQCRMEIDESINLTNEVSIDSWQCQMEIDDSLNAERQVGTWQSLPEISQENGDFTSEQIENPNVELGTHASNATSPDSEGAIISITAHLPVSRVISFQDHHASGNNNP